MGDIAVRIEGLGKRYQIGARQQPRTQLREVITDAVSAPFRRAAKLLRGEAYGAAGLDETIWALRDVWFEVKKGEVVGIVGRNGAGKSTLLKILSRITEPSEGRATVHGRVGALLEVGTGFHAELTGRENVYLNGAILGMSQAEITRNFDEIVAFAEIDKFIDTPVKHYSSGMYLRLAFAVAAHLEPEVLIIDEVLAVGDAAFQKKCIGKMNSVAEQGRTILFVSHNMPTVLKLCHRGVLLAGGRITRMGDVQTVVQEYLQSQAPLSSEILFGDAVSPKSPNSELVFTAIRILNHQRRLSNYVDLTNGLYIEIGYRILRTLRAAQVSFSIWNQEDVCILTSSQLDPPDVPLDSEMRPGDYMAQCFVPPDCLRAGRYSVTIDASIPLFRGLDQRPNCIAFEVIDNGSPSLKLSQRRMGVISPVLSWSIRQVD